jgi:hypothetical protein
MSWLSRQIRRATPQSNGSTLARALIAATIASLLWASCGSGARVGSGGGLIWVGVLPGNLKHFGWIEDCPGPRPPQGVAVVDNPVHPGWRHSLRFTVSDQSVHANCPVLGSPGNPSASVLSPPLFKPGRDLYIGFSAFFPAGFPSVCTPGRAGCFMQLMEVYGRPWGGAPPIGVLVSGRRIFLSTHVAGEIWTAPEPIPYGTAWSDFVIHVRFDTRASVGFVELWFDGIQRRFKNGSTRFYESTLQPGVNWDGIHPNALYLQQYRGANPQMGTLTLYETGAKVGTSYASVAPVGCSWVKGTRAARRWVCPVLTRST